MYDSIYEPVLSLLESNHVLVLEQSDVRKSLEALIRTLIVLWYQEV